MVRGDGGDDVLLGEVGKDTLRGGTGSDTLDGGAGNDSLYGGGGADQFIFSPGGRHDRIFDIDTSSDKIDLRDFHLPNAGEVGQLASDIGNGVLIDFGSNDDLIVEGIAVSDLTSELLML